MTTTTSALKLITRVGALLSLCAALSLSAAQPVRYEAQAGGSKMKVDGTSTLHDWTLECGVIAGFMELDASFPDSGDKTAPSAVKPRVEVSVPVRQLKSGKKSMDAVMYDAMKQEKYPKVEYRIIELKPKPGGTVGSTAQFDATGALTVAGVTRTNTMPVAIERIEKTKLKVTGVANVKMTDFGIKPPSPDVPGLSALIKTGDDVKITFEWLTAQPEAAK
jgi:polyisoprenoid-binding protein YceI